MVDEMRELKQVLGLHEWFYFESLCHGEKLILMFRTCAITGKLQRFEHGEWLDNEKHPWIEVEIQYAYGR